MDGGTVVVTILIFNGCLCFALLKTQISTLNFSNNWIPTNIVINLDLRYNIYCDGKWAVSIMYHLEKKIAKYHYHVQNGFHVILTNVG